MKSLYILRHAKAGEHNDDHERPLVEKGINGAKLIASYMKDESYIPDKILSSSAVRAFETIDIIVKKNKIKTEIEKLENLYLSSPNEILKEIRKIDNSINSLLLAGHNPGFHQLAMMLAKSGDMQLIRNMSVNFPPGSLVKIDFHDGWEMIDMCETKIVDFITPKMLRG